MSRTTDRFYSQAGSSRPPPPDAEGERTVRMEMPDDGPALACPECGTRYSGANRFCPFDGAELVRADPLTERDPLIGKKISGRFDVVGVLAEGSMGTVYEVRHAVLGSSFAMKVLRRDLAEDKELAKRLIEEARATAAIGHSNIVAVSDFGEIGAETLPELGPLKLPFFVMERLAGSTLGQEMQSGPMAPERAAAIAVEVAKALAAAHAVGIIHRDLKPDNVRVAIDGAGKLKVKVLDFGLAKVIGGSKKTQPGIVFGTPHYMSPEQSQGQELDGRSDVYALGVILYEALSGARPFTGDSYMAIVRKHIFEAPVPLAKRVPALAAHPLVAVVDRCLEKDREGRFGTMRELVTALEALKRPVPAGHTMPGAPPVAVGQGGTGWRNAAIAAGLVLLGVGTFALIRATEPAPAPTTSAAPPSTGAPATSPAPAPEPTATAAAPSATAVAAAPTVSAVAPPPEPSAAPPPPARPAAPRPAPPRRPVPRPRPGGEVVDPWG